MLIDPTLILIEQMPEGELLDLGEEALLDLAKAAEIPEGSPQEIVSALKAAANLAITAERIGGDTIRFTANIPGEYKIFIDPADPEGTTSIRDRNWTPKKPGEMKDIEVGRERYRISVEDRNTGEAFLGPREI